MVVASSTTTKYTHLELGKDVIFGIAGYYTPQEELKLKYKGREVLYAIGQVVIESACCGTSSCSCSASRWTYTIVPGYIVNWQNTKNEVGLPISEVEPITDGEVRDDIIKIIQSKEGAFPIEFW
jgi:hypothetical protein